MAGIKRLALLDPVSKLTLLEKQITALGDNSAVISMNMRSAQYLRDAVLGDSPLAGVDFWSKDVFIKQLILSNLPEYEIISENVRLLIIGELIETMDSGRSLDKFKRNQLLREIIAYFEKCIILEQKIDDPALSKLFNEYNKQLEQRKLLSAGGAMRKLLEKERLIVEKNELIFDNIYFLAPIEKKLISKVIDSMPDADIYFYLEYSAAVPGLQFAEDAYDFYKTKVAPADVEERFSVKSYTAELFSAKLQMENDIEEAVKIAEYADIETEIEQTARAVKRLIIDENVNPSEIYVIALDLGVYQRIIRDKFEEYEIPMDISKGIELKQAPFLAFLNRYFAIKSSGWLRYNDIYDILTSTYTAIPEKYKSFSTADIHRILTSLNLLRYKKSGYFLKIKDFIMSDYADDTEKQADLTAFFTELEALVRPYKKMLTSAEFINGIISFFSFFRVNENIYSRFSENMEELERNIHVVNRLNLIFKELHDIERFSNKSAHSAKWFISFFRSIVSSSEYHMTPKKYDSVNILGLFEFRNHFARHLFFLGGVEDNFPSFKYGGSQFGFFNIEFKKLMGEQKYLFTNYLYRFSERLTGTYFQMFDEKPMVRSQYFEELMIFPGTRFVSIDEPADDRAAPFSVNEYLKHWWSGIEYEEQYKTRIERIKRLASIYRRRLDIKSDFGEYEGVIGSAMSAEALRKYRIDTRPGKNISAYALEALNYCPMKFYFQYILRLAEPVEPIENPEKTAEGTVFHEIFQVFYEQWKEKTGQYGLRSITEAQVQEAERTLSDITKRLFDEKLKPLYVNPLFYSNFLNRILFNKESKQNILQFIVQEKNSNSEPVSLESREDFVLFDKYRVSVRLDRLDILDAGDEDEPRYMVADYKKKRSGYITSFKNDGINIQIPLYMYFLDTQNPEYRGKIALGQVKAYYEYSKGKTKTFFEMEDVSNRLEPMLVNMRMSLDRGAYNYTQNELGPDESSSPCRYCSFKNICYVNYKKVKMTKGKGQSGKDKG